MQIRQNAKFQNVNVTKCKQNANVRKCKCEKIQHQNTRETVYLLFQ